MASGKIIFALIFAAVILSGCTAPADTRGSTERAKEIAFVNRAIDGDTVELDNNSIVRILGINTPEKGEYYYPRAHERMRELTDGKLVELEIDGPESDAYGRKLRHVFAGGENVALTMIQEGFGIAYMHKQLRYSEEFETAQNSAKLSGLGIWEKTSEACGECIAVKDFVWDARGDDCSNPNGEFIVLNNACGCSCDLNGWSIRDESASHNLPLEDLSIGGGNEITVYSGCGESNSSEIYWCAEKSACMAVWNNGHDTLFIRAGDGKLVLEQGYSSGGE